MGISAAATEARATALIAECRRILACGGTMGWQDVKKVLDQLESATVNNLSGRTDVLPDNFLDGRDAAEAAVIA